jgi:hypothetical protein
MSKSYKKDAKVIIGSWSGSGITYMEEEPPVKKKTIRATVEYKKIILIDFYKWMQMMIMSKRLVDPEYWLGDYGLRMDRHTFSENDTSDPLKEMFYCIENVDFLLQKMDRKIIKNFSKDEANAVYSEIKKNKKRKVIPDSSLMYGCILKKKGFIYDCGQCPYGVLHNVCEITSATWNDYKTITCGGQYYIAEKVGEKELRNFLDIFFI